MERRKCRLFVVYKESVNREMASGIVHIATNVEWMIYAPVTRVCPLT